VSKTILITNIGLLHRSGTEVVVEQLADGLRRRGHRPILFAPYLGPLAESMRERGFLVIDRPDGLLTRPDVIHAHHTGPAMAALTAYPGVPALFVSHDASALFDTLPLHPRVRRIFAVDERCRARLVADGADPDKVELLPNAVDLSRIPARRAPLPGRPVRAVAVTKHAAHLPALRAACAAAGIALEEYGAGIGRIVDRPETLFAEADLVFATARTALEAAAAGSGVVVCDGRGCAGFLTRAKAQAWLPYNFGAGVLAHPCDVEQVSAAIADWSAAEAAAAAALVHEQRGLEAHLDRLELIYDQMLAEVLMHDEAGEAAAVGNFIAGWVPHYDQRAPWRRLAEQVSSPPLGSPIDALETGINTGINKVVERLAAVEADMASLKALQSEARKQADHAIEAGVMAISQKLDKVGDGIEHLAALQSEPGLGARIAARLGGIWRRVLPPQIRAPLYRLRKRLLARLRT